MRRFYLCFLVAAWSLAAPCAEPVVALRLRGPYTADLAQWEKTRSALARHPACCDEVWFSTGIGLPPLAWHRAQAARIARASADVRALGLAASLQIQATLGHSDALSAAEDCSAKAWTGWTGPSGVEDRFCSCPRARAFLAYVREMACAYAVCRPVRVWIDDDLRISHHPPASTAQEPGCWCADCLAAFNAETGGAWTRPALAAACARDAALAARWKTFAVAGVARVAAVIAEAFARLSPETRFGYQHNFNASSDETVKAVVAALHRTGGRAVGLRPGGGMYYDIDPKDQVVKSILAAACRRRLGDPREVDVWCPEVESWPRAYGSRSAQSVLVEGFTALAWGLNAVSLFVTDTRYETDDLYARTLFAPLAEGGETLRAYAAANAGTEPAGFETGTLGAGARYRLGLTGVPLLMGVGRSWGALTADERACDVCQRGSADVQRLRDACAARVKGPAVSLATPFVGLLMPRVAPDGSLRTVALLNTRIDAQGPVTFRFTGLPAAPRTVVWRTLRHAPVELTVRSAGETACVTLPSLAAWEAGFLSLSPVQYR